MALPTAPSNFAVEHTVAETAHLTWEDVSDEASYRVEASPAEVTSRQLRDYLPLQQQTWIRGFQFGGLTRRALATADGHVMAFKESLVADTEEATYEDLDEATTYCWRVRSISTGGEAASAIICASTQACVTNGANEIGISLPSYNEGDPAESFNEAMQTIEFAVNGQVFTSPPCIVCADGGCIVLDMSKCDNFLVIVEDDICCIQMIGGEAGQEGTIYFAFTPCANFIPKAIAGFPPEFGFTGGECSRPFENGCGVQLDYYNSGDGPRAKGVPILQQTPVVIPGKFRIICENDNCEVDCTLPTKKLELRAVGGTPPYTWSTTYGTITPHFVGNTTATLSVNNTVTGHNVPADIGYIACHNYCADSSGSGDCNRDAVCSEFFCDDTLVTDPTIFSQYSTGACAGVFNSAVVPFDEADCSNGSEIAGDPPDEYMEEEGIVQPQSGVVCATEGVAGSCIGSKSYPSSSLQPAIDRGVVTPARATYACRKTVSGCEPCGMLEGAVVTLTDATGRTTTKIIHTDMGTLHDCS